MPAWSSIRTLIAFLMVFVVVGVGLVFINLTMGALLRPRVKSVEKEIPYECGEEPVGIAWVQFDLRFYVVALLFVIFEVELFFFFPWMMQTLVGFTVQMFMSMNRYIR